MSHFQGQKVKVTRPLSLLSTTLTRKSAATVSVGSIATLRLLGSAQRGEERGGGILCRHAHSLLNLLVYVYLMYVFCLLSALLPIQVQGALGHIQIGL